MARFSSPLGGAGFLLLSLCLSGCRAVWRYRTNAGYYYIFSTRTTIYLEYEGTLFVEWDIPSLCTVANKSSPNTSLRCPVPGTHKIKPKVTHQTFEDMERYLPISADMDCFLWYVYLYQGASNSSNPQDAKNSQDVITWILDPENADVSELNYTATSPSAYSQVLSKQFWNLGQGPAVKTFFHRLHYTATAFPEQGIWKIKVPVTMDDMIAHIYGKAITFQDCFVVDTPLVIAHPTIHIPIANTVSVSSPVGSSIMISWSECFPTYAILVTDFGTFHTHDGFITSHEIKFPSSIINMSLIHSVKAVAVYFDHFMLLIGDVVYKIEKKKISRLGKDMGLPESRIIGIRSRTWSPSEYPDLGSSLPQIFQKRMQLTINEGRVGFPDLSCYHQAYMLTWTNYWDSSSQFDNPSWALLESSCSEPLFKWKALRSTYVAMDSGPPAVSAVREDSLSEKVIWTNDEVYLQSRNQWHIFLTNKTLLKEVLKFPPAAVISILNVCFDSLPNEIALLIECNGCTSTRVLYLAAVDEQTDQWFLRAFSLPASTSGVMNMEVLYSASTSMLLWDDDKVYYTYEGNKVNGYLKVTGTNKIFSAAAEGSTIHQVVIDHEGNTIIKLKNNIMFFLKFEMTHAVKLAAWENELKSFGLYWIIAGTIYLLTVDGRHITRQTYPLKKEVFSAMFTSQEVCPYISFQHSVKSKVYYLDKKQNVSFWTQIVFLENLGLSTEISVHRPNLLKQKTDLHYEIARGICTKKHTITFYNEQDYSDYTTLLDYYSAISKSTGVMTIEMKPSASGKTCASKNAFFHIHVGCPPFRHLVVKRPSSCKDLNFTFTIPRKHTWFKTSEDLTIQYDKRMFGCPIDAYYGDPFRPLVMLYDGDTFIDVVESEYVLWEMNGRTDFFYNATMNEAQCLHYAQNWHSMIHEDDDQNLTFEEIDHIWGPHNYQTCFNFGSGHSRNMHEPYEILNHSGISSIIWPQYHTGVYLFRLKILDPNFSFCDLSALFAVRTYGIIESPNGVKVAGFSILIVTLFLGVLVFSYFRYAQIFHTVGFVDPLQSLHPRHHATTAEKHKKEE